MPSPTSRRCRAPRSSRRCCSPGSTRAARHRWPSRPRRGTTPNARSPRSARSSSRRGLTVSVDGGQRLIAGRLCDSRRHLVRGVLDGGRGGAARIENRDRRRRPQPHADGAHRRAATVWRPRLRRGRRHRRRRAARNDRRRGRSDGHDHDRARGGARADRRAAGDRRAGGSQRRSDRPRRRGAARQGKRSHCGAGGRPAESRHLGRRVARWLHRSRHGRADAAASPTRTTITASRWRWPSPPWAREARRRSTAPSPSPSRIPASSRRWAGSSRESRQALRGRLHGGRQDPRWRGRWRSGSAGSPWTSTS